MSDQAAAGEQPIAETEPGVDPNQLNPHLGHQDPEQQKPDGDQDAKPKTDKDDDGAGTPPDGEESTETKPDDDALQRKVGELAFENRQLKRQLDARDAANADDPAEDKPEPLKTLKDFGYDEVAFNEYLVEETSSRTAKKLAKTQAQDTAKTEAQRRADEFAAREDAFEAENPGFKERLHDENLRISPEMAMFISDPANEVGLHVGDYLSQNQAEAAKIAGMPPTQQMREMVKLEDRISKEVAKAKAEKNKASDAPAPPANPVDGTDPGVGDVDPASAKSDELDDDEWMRRRNKQIAERRKNSSRR